MPADLVLLAMGFLHPEHEGCVDQLGVDLDPRGNVKAPTYATSRQGRLRRRRRAPRPVADRVGDQRGPPGAPAWPTATCASSAPPSASRSLAGNVHDADEGPEGPPSHVNGALTVET